MWSRSDLKFYAKQELKTYYIFAVIISFVLMIATGGASSSSSGSSSISKPDFSYSEEYYHHSPEFSKVEEHHSIFSEIPQQAVFTAFNWFSFGLTNLLHNTITFVFGSLMITIAILVLLLRLFLMYPLSIGCYRFFITKNPQEKSLSSLFFSYQSGYWLHHVGIMVKRDIFLFLWSLLFIIPGIIKSYEYRMIPYLVAQYPDISSEEAFYQSKLMMNGQKWNTFLLDLSFLPWHLLSLVTFRLAGIFYVNPYVNATNAALYDTLKKN